MKNGTVVVLSVIVFVFGLVVNTYADDLKTIKVMSPAGASSPMDHVIAERLGFYKEDGLQVEVVIAPLTMAVQAVLGGSADYVRHGSIIGAILGGVPFKVLAVNTDRSPQFIVAKPEIANIKALAGKTVGVDDIAGSANWVVRETLLENGVRTEQVIFRRLGPPPKRLQGLLAGVVDAAPLNFRLSRLAQKKGYRVLAYGGDFTRDVQMTAATSAAKIGTSREEVYKFTKATLKAVRFRHENPDEAYKFFLELEQFKDDSFAREAWRHDLSRASKVTRFGLLDDKGITQSIQEWMGIMKLADRPLKMEGRPEDIYDFSFVRRANQELETEGFDPKNYRYKPKQ